MRPCARPSPFHAAPGTAATFTRQVCLTFLRTRFVWTQSSRNFRSKITPCRLRSLPAAADHTLLPQITPCRRRRQPWPAAPSATPSKPYSKPHYKPYYKPYYQPYDNPALLVTRPSRAQGLHENWVVGATRTCGVALITALSA